MELKAIDIHSGYNGKEIVKGVSIKVKSGSFTSLVGPNGSGKSTLLKCLYRVNKATNGTILLDDVDINTLTRKELALSMAVVAQFNEIQFPYSVMDVVLMGRTPHLPFMGREKEVDYKIAEDALRKVGLYEFKDRNFENLSGGEKQRVILARAFAQECNLLILDEPTNHLDIRYQLEVLSLIKQHSHAALTALHDLTLAASFSDYIYMLKDGLVKYEGTPREVITRENIQDVYNVDAHIFDSPIDGKMMIEFKN